MNPAASRAETPRHRSHLLSSTWRGSCRCSVGGRPAELPLHAARRRGRNARCEDEGMGAPIAARATRRDGGRHVATYVRTVNDVSVDRGESSSRVSLSPPSPSTRFGLFGAFRCSFLPSLAEERRCRRRERRPGMEVEEASSVEDFCARLARILRGYSEGRPGISMQPQRQAPGHAALACRGTDLSGKNK